MQALAAHTDNTARRLERGLTMTEMMTVVAIVGVLAGSAVPLFRESNQKRVLDGSAGEVVTDVYLARSEAVARQQGVRLSVHSVTTGTCMVIHTGSIADCACDGAGGALCTNGAELVKSVLYPAARGITVTANVASMRFDQTNGTVSPAGTVRMIANDGTEVRHVVNILGRVRTCSPGGSAQGYKAC